MSTPEMPGTVSEPLRVLLIGGSRAEPSRTRTLLAATAQILRRRCVLVDICDVGLVGRRWADGTKETLHPAELRSRVERAHALVVATPTYHGSYSGVIKLWLDQLDRSALAGKPTGLMATCGGIPTTRAVDHLRIVVHTLGAIALPAQVVGSDSSFRLRDGRMELADALLVERIRHFADELIWFATQFHPERHAAAQGPARNGAAPVDGARRPSPVGGGDCMHLQPGDFPDQIMKAVEYIRTNFAKGPLPLNDVASEACMSRYHFSRTFKRETGTRFIDFLTTVRLAEACSLLARTNQSITTISFAVGYRDLSHFERTFKKEFGHPPSEYRERVRKGLEVLPQLPWAEEREEDSAAQRRVAAAARM
jgi:NAD(P)H-dependent FMN reductase/AraC-like DNA-binding protein